MLMALLLRPVNSEDPVAMVQKARELRTRYKHMPKRTLTPPTLLSSTTSPSNSTSQPLKQPSRSNSEGAWKIPKDLLSGVRKNIISPVLAPLMSSSPPKQSKRTSIGAVDERSSRSLIQTQTMSKSPAPDKQHLDVLSRHTESITKCLETLLLIKESLEDVELPPNSPILQKPSNESAEDPWSSPHESPLFNSKELVPEGSMESLPTKELKSTTGSDLIKHEVKRKMGLLLQTVMNDLESGRDDVVKLLEELRPPESARSKSVQPSKPLTLTTSEAPLVRTKPSTTSLTAVLSELELDNDPLGAGSRNKKLNDLLV